MGVGQYSAMYLNRNSVPIEKNGNRPCNVNQLKGHFVVLDPRVDMISSTRAIESTKTGCSYESTLSRIKQAVVSLP
jgi:hypothetical protein